MKRLFQLAFVLLTVSSLMLAQAGVHERYRLHPGDVLELNYRYTPEFNQTVTIQPDGYVNLAIAGQMHLAGMAVDDAHDAIIARVSSQLNQPELNLVLKEFLKPTFIVAGEVERTGRYDLVEKTTALQAIMQCGGFKDSAQQSQVIVFRNINQDIAEVHVMSLKKVKHVSDLERDVLLEPGDIVFVPTNKLEHLARFIKSTNLGLYFNPVTYSAAIP